MEGIVLKASAGTGKTYRLSLEYLATLLKGESYKNILVMTFTKKATSEIQERVILFLEEMYRDKKSDLYNNIKKLYPDIDLSHNNIKRAYFEILDNKDRLKISTIDGFINNIFKNVIAPYLNIFSYEIIDDKENQEILLKCFEKIITNKDEFSRFKIFLQNRTERDIEKYLNILKKLIENRWKIILINQLNTLSDKENYDSRIEIEKLLKHIVDIFVTIKDRKKDGKNLEDYISKILKWTVDTDIENYKDIAIQNWNEILKSEKCWDGRRVKTTKAINLDEEIELLSKAFSELKEELSKEIFNTEIIGFEKEILSFIHNFYSIYDEIKFYEKKFTHLDISTYMYQYIDKAEINLIKDSTITQYFKDIFDSEFKIIFIDEFQDTSILQWKILIGIINSSEKLICVGDEKQSIYGWRGGEKALFENLPNILNLKEENMDTSYRSYKNILEFTNKVFSDISYSYKEEVELEDNQIDREWEFTPVNGESSNEGYVEVIESIIEDEESEIDSIDLMIESIEINFLNNLDKVAVIARSNKQLNEIALKLSEKKIPYIIESNDSIIYHKSVNPIFKILRYIVNRDILSLLEFLRSDVVKIDNITLKLILNNRDVVNSYLFEEIDGIDSKLNDLLLILNKIRFIISKGFLNTNFILDIIESFNISKYYDGKSDLKNIFQFLQMSKQYENIIDFYNSLVDEEDNPKFKQVSLEGEKSVTLLSVHKSKGLEFETVYYYHNEGKKGLDSGIQFYIDFKSPFNNISNFIFIDKKYEKILKYLEKDYMFLDELEIKKEQEELNNIYVALTRAKKNLFLVLGKNQNKYLKIAIENLHNKKYGKILKEDVSLEKDILEKNNKEFLEIIDFKDKTIETDQELNRILPIDIVSEEKRIVGTAIHFYLEFIFENSENEHIEARSRTYSKYASIIGENRLKKILDSEEFKRFFIENPIIFSKEWDYIYPEYELYDSEDGLKRIDRLMIKNPKDNLDGEILIVDYKTGGLNDDQLNEYIKMVGKHLSNLEKQQNYIITGKFLEIKL